MTSTSPSNPLVAQSQPQSAQVVEAAPAHVGVNFFDPKQFEVIQRTSLLFASSKLVPAMYQIGGMVKKGRDAKPVEKSEAIANCIIALDIASRIGAAPLMVMQNLVIIEGRPSWSSKFLIATVNTCGRFEPLKFKFTEKGLLGKVSYTEYVWDGRGKVAQQREFDGTAIQDIECVAYTTKRGGGELLESSPISLRMAVNEGWFTKNGSKWRTMPKQMLMYRAASFWTNAYAPELSMGMRTVEENQDITYVEAEEVPDVAEQVEQEKAANANKETLSMGETAADAGQSAQASSSEETSPSLENAKPSLEISKPSLENAKLSPDPAEQAPAY